MAQSIPSVPVPPLVICRLVRPFGEEFVRKPLSRALSIILEAVNVVPFSSFHLKTCLIIFIEHVFNNFAIKRCVCMVFPPSLLYPTVVLHKKLLAAIVISSHMEEKQSMYRLKSIKEKNTVFVSECLRQKGLKKLCEIFES